MAAEIWNGSAWVTIQDGLTSTVTIRQEHVYAIEGNVTTSKLFVPFQVSVAGGESLYLAGVRRRCGGGSGTLTIRKNGVSATGFGGLTVDTTKRVSMPTAVLLTDGDEVDMILASGSLTTWASFTIIMSRTAPTTVIS